MIINVPIINNIGGGYDMVSSDNIFEIADYLIDII